MRQIAFKMIKLALTCVALLAVSMILMCINILLKKNGRFRSQHVGANKAMRDNKVGCVQSQDFQMRLDNPRAVKERL